ncbi:indole-3-glycerol phosphate synthase TrpC [Reichenbachiella ulvae]|uniref:Indole-3-glycerol phosphate synthase n=1 Tax=Reichenbachiella ulvae TaxID=2980104 RepID=A0ABT3CPH1_9BACT|nr:indole-3-glycerol phosphate synthase TrpC [Reichenbachiella ulvae]MCV9385433.1 indole-3-glycerol phosphate synthase TrpC [Reichenbachiella ulvae]
MNVLDKIVAEKRKEIEAQKALNSIDQLTKMEGFSRKGFSTADRMKSSVLPAIISEFKRQSPSKGIINDKVDVVKVTQGYCEAGASAVSILTDEPFFGGTIEDLQRARPHVSCPILRKDFIIDEYQIYKTKAIGADLMLLIAAILTKEEIKRFTSLAHELGLEVLLEIHNQEEFEQAYIPEVDILGVNNRDLKRFKTTIQNSIDLSEILPKEQLKISESGISTTQDMADLTAAGYKGFLIGEQFMKHADPAAELKKFMKEELV